MQRLVIVAALKGFIHYFCIFKKKKIKLDHIIGQELNERTFKKNKWDGGDGKMDGSQTIRVVGDKRGKRVRGDVTVNQHFSPLLPPGPHVAHQHSRTWRGTA